MNHLENLFFDLDGPILDVSDRYYHVHRTICRRLGITARDSKRDYWERKRARTSLGSLLGTDDEDPLTTRYRQAWLNEIEKHDVLALDSVFPFAHQVLESLARKYAMALVTLRRNQKAVQEEINGFGLARYFGDRVFVVRSDNGEPHAAKCRAFSAVPHVAERSLVIGDTEVDIHAARASRIGSVGVLSGIRNRETMRRLGPDHIVQDIRGLLTELQL